MTRNNSRYLKSRRRNPSRNEDNKIKPRGRGTVTYKRGLPNITNGAPASKFNKHRLGLKSAKDLSKSGIKLNKIINKNANEKTIQKINEGREIKLFTKHFDARAKIESKHIRSPAKSSLVNLDGVAQKALDDVRKNTKAIRLNERRNLKPLPPTPRNRNNLFRNQIQKKKLPTLKYIPANRESTFTGKSIQVVAKNDLSTRERKNLLKSNAPGSAFESKTKGQSFGSIESENETSPMYSDYYQSRQQSKGDQSSKKSIPAKVIISNLHTNVTQDDIKELFGAIGALRSARLVNIGTAECVYENAEDAFAAYTKYHTRNLDGQPMVLKITSVDATGVGTVSSSMGRGSSRPSQQYTPRDTPRANLSGSQALSSPQPGAGKPVVFTVKL